jgi:hypothetical protein
MGDGWTYLNEQVDDLIWVCSTQRAELQRTERDRLCCIRLVDEVILVGSGSRSA